jgi:sigma-B regulation protein RsbU (phosphoserine phosphatase)
MLKLGARYIWFKFALVAGSLLGLLLLYQSFSTYYQVSRIMVLAELRREAQRQVNLLARDAIQVDFQDPANLRPVLDELRQEAPTRIAWIRLIDLGGHTLVQSGTPAGAPASIQPRQDGAPPPADVRSTEHGRVLVTVLPLPLRDRRHSGQPGNSPSGAAPKERPGRPRPAEPGRTPSPGYRPGPRMVEIALYMAGASATFGSLLRNLIINSSAAIGLVASMILIWARFPNYVRGKQLEQQTELARQVQTDLLPPANLTFKNVDFAAECVPAWQVGGDFYDLFSTPEGRVAIVLGDVSGKGLPASVVAGLLLGAIRSSAWLQGSAEHEAASTQLSELLRTRTAVERFASLFWCYYEPETRELRYVNAGHLPPMVVSRNRGPSGSAAVEIQRLEDGGPVLGVLPSPIYRQATTVVADGSLFVLYSDGVVEATNASDEQFGEERLRAILSRSADKPSTEIRDEILKQVQLFLGKERAQDDLTLVVARLQSSSCALPVEGQQVVSATAV